MAVVKSRNFILPILFLASISSSILSFCQGATKVTEVGQAFLREPFDQIAIVGEHVTLPCRVVNKRGVLQWTRDDFGLGTDRNLTGFKRYRMSGSDEEEKVTFGRKSTCFGMSILWTSVLLYCAFAVRIFLTPVTST